MPTDTDNCQHEDNEKLGMRVKTGAGPIFSILNYRKFREVNHMTELTVRVKHDFPLKKLSQIADKGIKKLSEKFRKEKIKYSIKHSWNKDKTECDLSGKYFGKRIEGALMLNQKSVIISANLPLIAKPWIKDIRRIIRETIKEILGYYS